MIGHSPRPFQPRALIVDEGFAHPETAIGRATEGLARALEQRGVESRRVVQDLQALDGRREQENEHRD